MQAEVPLHCKAQDGEKATAIAVGYSLYFGFTCTWQVTCCRSNLI